MLNRYASLQSACHCIGLYVMHMANTDTELDSDAPMATIGGSILFNLLRRCTFTGADVGSSLRPLHSSLNSQSNNKMQSTAFEQKKKYSSAL